ncbi:MAG: Tol-Pal system protein TolB, partial [Novosphingobium sp.]|nr:Tol-Pal system protein TolB [Novosphingobium sp.]
MSLRLFAPLALVAALFAATASSQPVVAPEAVGTASAQDEGLTGSVSDDSEWQDLGIAITVFATDRDVPTSTAAGSTSALGRALSQVIADNLRNNGLFRPSGPAGLPQPTFEQVPAPDYPVWRQRSAEMLVQGYVRAQADGRLVIGCYLYDVALGQQLAKAGWEVPPEEWRRAAHKCSDMVYSRLTGENPFFDSRIAYIAETGPKDRRIKRLAVMDSDGANHRYLTSGQSIALTPRYSPDYKSILYLSYLNGYPSVYIYDLETDRQRLVTRSTNPIFAPRWSPDGRYVFALHRDGTVPVSYTH